MATSRSNYLTTKPGLEHQRVSDSLHVAPSEGPLGFFSANRYSAAVNKTLSEFFGVHDYQSARWTATTDDGDGGGGGAAATVAWGSTGVVLTAAQSNDDVSIRSVRTAVLAANKVYTCLAKVTIDDADKMGLAIGFVTSSVGDPLTTAPTDGVFFAKAKTAATLVGRVIANGGAAADTGTLATVADATAIEVGFRFVTNTDGALCSGKWWVDGTATSFTAAQLTALDSMVTTTAPTLAFVVGGTAGESSSHTITVSYAFAEVDA